MIAAATAGLACLSAVALAPSAALAQWRVREVQEPAGSGTHLEITYRSSGERLTVICGPGSAFVSFAPGYRMPAAEAPVEGRYSIDGRPPKPLRWRITRNSAFVTAGFAMTFVADLAGARQLEIAFPSVEQTYDLTPLLPHAERLKALCTPAS